MTGPLRRALARLVPHRPPGPPPTGTSTTPPATTDASIGRRLDHLRVAYQETLDATKHQDDKIGRFMAGIAFLIAGALVFTNPTVLQATYLVGDTSLPLPALALGTFLVLVVLSLFFYVLAMGAPLTIAPGTTLERRSHQYFLVIAGETTESWQAAWARPKGLDPFKALEDLERQLADEEVDEIRNLAIRADLKYERANEGSALFVLALLFFLLGMVLSIQVIQLLEIPDGNGTTGHRRTWTGRCRCGHWSGACSRCSPSCSSTSGSGPSNGRASTPWSPRPGRGSGGCIHSTRWRSPTPSSCCSRCSPTSAAPAPTSS